MIFGIIFEPIDGGCYAIFAWLDELADKIVDDSMLVWPVWDASVFEVIIASPILLMNAWYESIEEFLN